MTKPLTPQTEEITKDVTKSGEMPQLSAEMEKRFDKEFGYLSVAIDYYVENAYPLRKESGMKHLRDIKQFLATALEDERNKVIEEVEEWIEYNEYSRPDTIEGFAGIVDTDDLLAKLNQLKGEGK